MNFNKWGFFGKVVVLLATCFCFWFFIYILPSTTVCKMGYEKKHEYIVGSRKYC